MNIYKELEQIAQANEQIKELAETLEKVIDLDGLDLHAAYFVDGCIEKDGHLYNGEGHRYDNSGLVDDDYYCNQHTGYLGDDFYGTIYFKTETDGRFIAVPFAM